MYTTLALRTYFNVGNNSLWNTFVNRNRAYWTAFIKRVVLKKSSGRPVLVVRYENIKRNRTTEVEGYRGGKGRRGGSDFAIFSLHGQSLYCLSLCLLRYYTS